MFPARLITACVLLAAFVSALFALPRAGWAAALLAALAVASWEWASLAGLRQTARGLYACALPVTAGAVWLLGGSEAGGAGPWSLELAIYGGGCTFWLLVALPWLAWGWRIRSPLALAVAGWFVLVPSWLAMVQLQADAWRLLVVLGVVWLADTAAYLCGKAWGKHKLAPRISPAKTWEGVAGAVAAVAVYYCVLSALVPDWGWWHGPGGAVLFAGVTIAGVVGDLFESWMKRQAGVKDSGSLLPGHGGVLDRIDSLASSLPFAALLMPYAV